MSLHRRRSFAKPLLLMATLSLIEGLAGPGCGSSGEGTVQVSHEGRARLTPKVAAKARGPRNQLVGERPVGIKARKLAGTPTP
jgi:hypothetical protein